MSDITIQFDPEKADLLRRVLAYRCASVSTDLEDLCGEYWAYGRKSQTDAEATARLKEKAGQVRVMFNLLEELGWELGTRGNVNQLTLNLDLLREIVRDGSMDIGDNLEADSSTEALKAAVQASEFYDSLEVQLPPEPAKVEA